MSTANNKPASSPPLISTSALAKRLNLSAKSVFGVLHDKGWIERTEDHWRLTGKGQFEGGDYVKSNKYGEYIGWPENTEYHPVFDSLLNRPLSAQSLGALCGVSAQRCNALLAELGWQTPFHQGWSVTALGRTLGGLEDEDTDTGIPYCLWPKTLIDHPQFRHAIPFLQPMEQEASITADAQKKQTSSNAQQSLGLETPGNNQAPYRCMDGHLCDHQEDFALDNWLYVMGIAHAYQRTLADEILGCADFYIPCAHLYIECWHSTDDAKLLSQKLARINHYKDNDIAYIELNNEDFFELDKVLPRQLLKNGINL